MALEMLDELGGWGLKPPVLIADAGYGQVAEFRQGLSERAISYVVATTSSTIAHPASLAPVRSSTQESGSIRSRSTPTRPAA
jgi:SRSO17 transposase